MKFIKFTTVKLMVQIFGLVCIVCLISPKVCKGYQTFGVQVAASKSPIDIIDFAEKYKIKDSIIELKSKEWNRYVVGNFDSYQSATIYANELIQSTLLTIVFPRRLSADLGYLDRNMENTEVAVAEDSIQTSPVALSENKRITSLEIDNHSDAIKLNTDTLSKPGLMSMLLFGGKNNKRLKEYLVNYADSHFPLYLRNFYVQAIDKIYQYPIILFFVFLIFILVLNVFIVLVLLYFTNQRKNHRVRYFKVYQTLYEGVLLSYLFGENNWETTLLKLKKYKRPLNRQILITILFNFHKNFKGEMEKQIPAVFVKLGLQNDAIKTSMSIFNYKKIQGIRELANMYPEGALKIVKDYIDHKHDEVRAEAQASYILLNSEKPFDFLLSMTNSFSLWTQLTAFNLFRLNQLPDVAFIDYLDSDHPNVRDFCLRMITYFQQLENAAAIFRLLESKMEVTRYLSIKAINDLRLYDGKEIIKRKYLHETNRNKLEIIKAFKNLGNEEDFDFLESIIYSGSISQKIEACRSMHFMSNNGTEKLRELSQIADFDYDIYIAHVIDKRN